MGRKPLFFIVLLVAAILLASPQPSPSADKPVVRFGIIPRYNPLIMYKRYQPIMDYLTEQTPYRFELKISRDYPEAVRFLREGTTQVSSLGDVTFAEANLQYAAQPILKPLNRNGVPYYRSAIIVRSDSPLRSIRDLRGKTMAFGSAHSTSGNLVPRYLLWNNGVRIQDLGRWSNLKNHDAVAKAILKGQFDAGAVKDVVAEKYMSHGLRVLAWSAPIPSVPIVVRSDTPPELVQSLKAALLRLDRTNPQHQKLMEIWDDEFKNGFTRATARDYADIFRMIKGIPHGCGAGCH